MTIGGKAIQRRVRVGKNQTAEHILQACPYHSALRDTIWPEETALQKKLYGPREDLERTARFALQSGLTI
ncbi:hypothetical protein V1264_019790 [Littorina saxatilis]|uniref:Uncharacterized protein n=1 Tax=Littorina saxatilis TaxID=31220 RepID=A0AAN9GA82_9CAEN